GVRDVAVGHFELRQIRRLILSAVSICSALYPPTFDGALFPIRSLWHGDSGGGWRGKMAQWTPARALVLACGRRVGVDLRTSDCRQYFCAVIAPVQFYSICDYAPYFSVSRARAIESSLVPRAVFGGSGRDVVV